MRRNRHSACVVAALACTATGASAADLALGKAKAAEACESCHGAGGNSTSQDFPKLGGQYPDYLAKALQDYKSGDRKNAIMAGFPQTPAKPGIHNPPPHSPP